MNSINEEYIDPEYKKVRDQRSAKRKETLRKKLLGIMPRPILEDVSGIYDASSLPRQDLIVAALSNWSDETIDIIKDYIDRTR